MPGRVTGASSVRSPATRRPDDVVVAVGGTAPSSTPRLTRDHERRRPRGQCRAMWASWRRSSRDRSRGALDRLLAGDFRISTRMTLEATLPDGTVVTAPQRRGRGEGGEPPRWRASPCPWAESRWSSTVPTPSSSPPRPGPPPTPSRPVAPSSIPRSTSSCVTAVAPHNLFGRPIVFGADGTPCAITIATAPPG